VEQITLAIDLELKGRFSLALDATRTEQLVRLMAQAIAAVHGRGQSEQHGQRDEARRQEGDDENVR
jgi:hypothetical protein